MHMFRLQSTGRFSPAFLYQNQPDALISKIYFWNRILHVSDRFSVHRQESSAAYTAIGIGHKGFADCLLAGSGS